MTTTSSQAASGRNLPSLRRARKWGDLEFVARLTMEEAADCDTVLASEEIQEAGFPNPTVLVAQPTGASEGDKSSGGKRLPLMALGRSQQLGRDDWTEPTLIASLWKTDHESTKGLVLAGSPRGADDLEDDDPDCGNWVLYLGENAKGEAIPDTCADLYVRRRLVEERKPKPKSARELIGL